MTKVSQRTTRSGIGLCHNEEIFRRKYKSKFRQQLYEAHLGDLERAWSNCQPSQRRNFLTGTSESTETLNEILLPSKLFILLWKVNRGQQKI